MDTSETICDAIKQCQPLAIGACKVCERTGLAILPLREAYVPLINPPTPFAANNNADPLKQLRTLRQGYLYVLLDKKYGTPTKSPPKAHCANL